MLPEKSAAHIAAFFMAGAGVLRAEKTPQPHGQQLTLIRHMVLKESAISCCQPAGSGFVVALPLASDCPFLWASQRNRE